MMKSLLVSLVLILASSPVFAFTRGDTVSLNDGWSIPYVFVAPDNTKGYTNIKVPFDTQNGSITIACSMDSPCPNSVRDENGNLTDPGTNQQPTYVQNLSDAQTYADGVADIKEQKWIAEIGQ